MVLMILTQIFSSCSYCDAKYNFIQKMETFDEDMEHILKALGLGPIYESSKKPHSNKRNDGVYSDELTLKYFSQIPHDIIKTLLEIYKYDFEAFGYSFSIPNV